MTLLVGLCLKDDCISFSSEIPHDPFQHLSGQTFTEHLNSVLKITHGKESHRLFHTTNLFPFMSFKLTIFSFTRFFK